MVLSDAGEAIDEARAEISASASDFMPDVLTIVGPQTEVRDTDGYITTADSNIELDVPCSYEALTAFERQAGGQMTLSASHRIRMPANEDTLAIQPNQRLVVAARGVTPALTFDVTGRLDSSTSVFLEVAAILRG